MDPSASLPGMPPTGSDRTDRLLWRVAIGLLIGYFVAENRDRWRIAPPEVPPPTAMEAAPVTDPVCFEALLDVKTTCDATDSPSPPRRRVGAARPPLILEDVAPAPLTVPRLPPYDYTRR